MGRERRPSEYVGRDGVSDRGERVSKVWIEGVSEWGERG